MKTYEDIDAATCIFSTSYFGLAWPDNGDDQHHLAVSKHSIAGICGG